MALTDKQILGKWNVTGKTLMARTFDEGVNFVLTEQKAGPSDTEDEFVLRTEEIFDRDDVTLTAGLDVAATKALLLNLTWPSGSVAGPTGLGRPVYPTNFDTPKGYAQISYDNGLTVGYRKAVLASEVKKVAASASDPASGTGTWWSKNKKYVFIAAGVIGSVLAFLGIRKAMKK